MTAYDQVPKREARTSDLGYQEVVPPIDRTPITA